MMILKMKTLHLAIIIFLFVLASVLSQNVFSSQKCSPNGHIHYGPSRQSILCYLASSPYNPTLEDQFGNSTKTVISHNGSILVLNQTTKKLVYKGGEEITIIPELINIGNKSADITYWDPMFVLEIKNQTNNVIWPKSTLVGYIPEFGGSKTLKPGEHFGVRPWTSTHVPANDPFPIFVYEPGNYTVISVATFSVDAHVVQVRFS